MLLSKLKLPLKLTITLRSAHSPRPHRSLTTTLNLLSIPTLPFETLQQSHALTITCGDCTNPFVAAKLVSLYASVRRPDLSSRVFSSVSHHHRDIFLWNSIIQAHFSNSYFLSALRLCVLMLASGALPDHFTGPMIASACAELMYLNFGSCFHGNCVKFGLLGGDFVGVGSSLVFMYSKCGSLGDAFKVFDEMTERDVISWTALIVGCVSNEEFELGLHCFKEMFLVGEGKEIRPNSRTLDAALQACAGLTASQEGRCLHGFSLKSGTRCCVSVGSSVLNMYSRCGRSEDVVLAFEELEEKDVVSCTAVASTYARNGLISELLKLLQEMMELGLELDRIFLSCMITGFANSGSLSCGKAFHCILLRRIVALDAMVSKALISMYWKFEQSNIAEKIFSTIVERDAESWNLMVFEYGKRGSDMKCLDLFRQMQFHGFGLHSDADGFVSVLSSCSQLGALGMGQSVHCFTIRNAVCKDSSSVHNALVGMYGRFGRVDLARRIFDRMNRDTVTWNTLIAANAHLGHYNEALALFDLMLAEGIKPSSATLVIVLSACANMAALCRGAWIHNYIRETKLECDLSLGTGLVDMYAKCGQLETSRKVFDLMPEKDIVAWNVMISAYGIHGHAKEALEAFREAEESGVKPNGVTFLAVLSACSHCGLVEEGKHMFARMKDYNIIPTVKHYTCMIDILGRSGKLCEAQAMVLSMPMKPDSGIWGALLGACKMYNNVEIGERVAKMAVELDQENDGYYTLLSNMYSCGGRWEEVEKLREVMKDRGVRKRAGWSALDLSGRVHTFTVGDKSHPESEMTHFVLEALYRQMEESSSEIRRGSTPPYELT